MAQSRGVSRRDIRKLAAELLGEMVDRHSLLSMAACWLGHPERFLEAIAGEPAAQDQAKAVLYCICCFCTTILRRGGGPSMQPFACCLLAVLRIFTTRLLAATQRQPPDGSSALALQQLKQGCVDATASLFVVACSGGRDTDRARDWFLEALLADLQRPLQPANSTLKSRWSCWESFMTSMFEASAGTDEDTRWKSFTAQLSAGLQTEADATTGLAEIACNSITTVLRILDSQQKQQPPHDQGSPTTSTEHVSKAATIGHQLARHVLPKLAGVGAAVAATTTSRLSQQRRLSIAASLLQAIFTGIHATGAADLEEPSTARDLLHFTSWTMRSGSGAGSSVPPGLAIAATSEAVKVAFAVAGALLRGADTGVLQEAAPSLLESTEKALVLLSAPSTTTALRNAQSPQAAARVVLLAETLRQLLSEAASTSEQV